MNLHARRRSRAHLGFSIATISRSVDQPSPTSAWHRIDTRRLRRLATGMVVATILAGASCTSNNPDRQRFALDTNGWTPGDPSRGVGVGGAFHAVRNGGTACAWIGDHREPTLWPKGWTVRFRPTELLDPNGNVVASEGETIIAGGITADRQRISTACAVSDNAELHSLIEVAKQSS